MTQDVHTTIEDGGLGTVGTSTDDIHHVFGCCEKGDSLVLFETASIKELLETFGYGPGVQAAAFSLKLTGGAPIIFCRLPTDTPGAASSVTFTGTGTSVITVTGDALDRYEVIFKVTAAGTGGTTIGVAGLKFRVSLDNGRTWGPERQLGTANSYAIPNTGLTLHFAAGDLDLADVAKFTTSEPTWADADVATAYGLLTASTQESSFVHVVGPCSKASADALDALIVGAEADNTFTSALVEARDANYGSETYAQWKAAVALDYAAFTSLHTVVAFGHYLTTSPIDSVRYRRSLAWGAAARAVSVPVHRNVGRVKDGRLTSVAMGPSPDSSDTTYYHDERVSPGMLSAGFMAARTRRSQPGVFIATDTIKAPPGSDFTRWHLRRVMNKACRTAFVVLEREVNDNVRLNKDTGFILEKDAVALERAVTSAEETVLLNKGSISGVTVEVARDDNILSDKTINVKVRIVPLGDVEEIEHNIGFTNPALEAAAAAVA